VLDPDQQPILWLEHFDVAILLDNRSYGSSPGDDLRPAPYAYDHDGGRFWNATFGALRDAGEFGSSDNLVAFLARGSSVAARDFARAPDWNPRVTVRRRKDPR
jgi:hypothetical protein